MNTQEIFNAAVKGVYEQAAVSMDGEKECKYRGPNGLKCAVGFLIKDEFYCDSFEGDTPDSPMVFDALRVSIGRELTQDETSMLGNLQGKHDTMPDDGTPEKFREVWLNRVGTVARMYGIKTWRPEP